MASVSRSSPPADQAVSDQCGFRHPRVRCPRAPLVSSVLENRGKPRTIAHLRPLYAHRQMSASGPFDLGDYES
jgi:hypothetical protein